MTNNFAPDALLRLKDVLRLFPVSRSTWYAGIKSGIYPEQLKLGARSAAWRYSDIRQLVESVSNSQDKRLMH